MTDAPRPARRDATLPPPSVPATAYDEEYYRTMCAGHKDWSASEGERSSRMYEGYLQVAGLLVPGETVVDIGTGRGDLVATAIRPGASRAWGVDYAEDGIVLARRTLEVQGVADRGEVMQGDARAIPLDGQIADLATLIDVVEHLAQPGLERVLAEAHRVQGPTIAWFKDPAGTSSPSRGPGLSRKLRENQAPSRVH